MLRRLSKPSSTSTVKPKAKKDGKLDENEGNLDFDDEARALWARLNLDEPKGSSTAWNLIDPIWKHPEGGGMIYVGNQSAAENLTLLRSVNITHVVNCTHGFSKIPNFHEGSLNYYNFPISHWQQFINGSHQSVIQFSEPMFQFIENAVSRGESVLVHCLAGAHRAGTTGCACLIYFADMDVSTAIVSAKRCRRIIDPIGQLPEFLQRLREALDAAKVGKLDSGGGGGGGGGGKSRGK